MLKICLNCGDEFNAKRSKRIYCGTNCSNKSPARRQKITDSLMGGKRHTQKHTKEAKNKMSIAKKGKHISPETEFKKGIKNPYEEKRIEALARGEKHYKYVGDKVGYHGVHSWVKKILGKPSLCEDCGATVSKRFMWHNISGEYLRNKEDWRRLCAKCHANLHKNWEGKK